MTDATAISTGVMTLDEFIRRFDQDGPFEILDGEIVPKMPNIFGHSVIIKKVFVALLPYEKQGLGEVFPETTFVLMDAPDWVKSSRIPDLLFVGAGRLEAYRATFKDWQQKPPILVPDLVIEVVSPNDQYSDIAKRVKRYFSDGVSLVWVIDPQTKEVIVHTLGSDKQAKLSGDATLKGSNILPDFQLKLSELFA